MKKFLPVMLIVVLIIFSASAAMAASLTLTVDGLTFEADTKQDLLGSGKTRTADGKVDATFTLSISGAQAIKEISLKNETTGKVWSTTSSGSDELLLVKSSSGAVVNTGSRMAVTPVLLAADFTLVINDAAAAISKDSTFVVSVTMIDNKVVTGKTTVKALAQPAPSTTAPSDQTPKTETAATDGISKFESRGKSEHDFAGAGEKVGSDGKNDFQFDLDLSFKEATVKGIKISAAAGSKKADWDTVADNKLPIITVIDKDSNIANKTNGTVSFTVKGTAPYTLLVQDNSEVLSASDAKIKILISLADGRMFEKEATKGKIMAAKDSFTVEYKGIAKYDFVGSDEKMESNMNPDRFISAVVNTIGTITGVRIKDMKTGKIWDTISGNKNPLVAVMSMKGEKSNKSDGPISIAIKDPTEMLLCFDEEDDKAVGPYQVTFVLSNGQLMEASTGTVKKSPSAAEETVTKADREVKFLSKKPAVVNVDLVGKSKKKGASGAKDMTMNLQVTGKGNITAMVLSGADGRGWDTLPSNNGRWLLGVRQGSKMLNAANGSVKIVVNGSKTYQLLMQDNGKLAAKTGKFTLTTTWGDGEVTETPIAW